MKTTASMCVLGLAALVGPAGAAEVDVSRLPAPAAKQGVTYERDVRPILEASCFRCHGAQRSRGDLRLDSLQAVLDGGEDGKVVVAGQSAKSPLVIAVAQLDEKIAMPPRRGAGGPGGFGPGMMLTRQMIEQGDKDADRTVSKDEFTALADSWFDKLDPDKTGTVTREQFVERFGALLPPPRQGFGRGGPREGGPGPGAQDRSGGQGRRQDGPGPRGGPDGFGPGRFIAPGFFDATDTDHDGSLTREEFKTTFAAWFDKWDAKKSDALDQQQIAQGLDQVLPRPNFAGPGGPGAPNGPGREFGGPGAPPDGPGPGPGGPQGQRGPGGFGGPGPGGFGGPGGPGGQPAKPLTPQQIALIRAWIDQGAK